MHHILKTHTFIYHGKERSKHDPTVYKYDNLLNLLVSGANFVYRKYLDHTSNDELPTAFDNVVFNFIQ